MREGRRKEKKKEKRGKKEKEGRKNEAIPQISNFIEEKNPTLLKGIQYILVLININILFSDQ